MDEMSSGLRSQSIPWGQWRAGRLTAAKPSSFLLSPAVAALQEGTTCVGLESAEAHFAGRVPVKDEVDASVAHVADAVKKNHGAAVRAGERVE